MDILQNITLIPSIDDIMLIRLGEQEQARMLEDVKDVFQNVRDKTYENSETCHISEICRDSGIRGMPGKSYKVKRRISASYREGESPVPGRPF